MKTALILRLKSEFFYQAVFRIENSYTEFSII